MFQSGHCTIAKRPACEPLRHIVAGLLPFLGVDQPFGHVIGDELYFMISQIDVDQNTAAFLDTPHAG